MATKKSVALINETGAGFAVPGAKVRGVAVCSDNGGQGVIKISLIDLAPATNGYTVAISGGNSTKLCKLPDLSGAEILTDSTENLAVLIFYVTADERFLSVAYGAFSSDAKPEKEVLENAKNAYRAGNDAGGQEKKSVDDETYDDEVVAAENYYAYESESGMKRGGGNENATDAYENVGVQSGGFKKKEADEYDLSAFVDEENGGEKGTYYERIKPQIERLFQEFNEEKSLSEVVPDSHWVKIKYDGDDYYVVGVIYDKNRPLYICYGVEGRYGEKPEKIGDYCSFIPSSIFNLKGDGYWVMYQSAITGKCLSASDCADE